MLAKQDDHHHKDGRPTAYFIFCWEGVSSLLPWCVFITAHAYFYERLCKTAFGDTFENYFSIAYTVTQPLGLLLSVKYSKMFSLKQQVAYPMALNCLIFAMMTMFVLIVSMDPHVLFGLTLLFTFISGVCTSFINGGLFGFAGRLPHAMTSGVMMGQGMASLIVALINVVATLASPHSDLCNDDGDDDSGEFCGYDHYDSGSFSYFFMATFILFTASVLFMRIFSLDYIKSHAEEWSKATLDKAIDNTQGAVTNPLSGNKNKNNNKDGDNEGNESTTSSFNLETGECVMETVTTGIFDNTNKGTGTGGGQKEEEETAIASDEEISVAEAWDVFKRIKVPALSILIVFATSLCLYPSLMVLIQTNQSCSGKGGRVYNDMWLPLLFVMFAAGDFLGRLSAQVTSHQTLLTAQNIWIPTVLRLCLIPLFLFCKIRNGRLPAAYTGAAMPIFLTLLLGLSNGYLGNMCMMLGPAAAAASHASNNATPAAIIMGSSGSANSNSDAIRNGTGTGTGTVGEKAASNGTHHDDAALAGILMVLCLSTGLLVGSILSFLVVYIATGSA